MPSAIILTISDRCHAGTQTDLSGPALAAILTSAGFFVLDRLTLPDELPLIADALRSAAPLTDLILTTGGTGLAPRDITPEATLSVCSRLVPGLAELIRTEGSRATPFAALGRGIAAICSTPLSDQPDQPDHQTLILNLPGSPTGATSSLHTVLPLLPHALDLLAGHTTTHPTS